MNSATYLTLLLMGLAGGIHCAAMCGGFAMTASSAGLQPVLFARRHARSTVVVLQHAGRLLMYALLGAAMGGVSAAGGWLPAWIPLQAGLFLAANLLLVAFGLGLLGRDAGGRRLEAFGMVLFARVRTVLERHRIAGGLRAHFALGLIWGTVPCGLVYAALAVAALAGHPLDGALLMLAFGLGTLPNLVAAQWVLERLRRFSGLAMARSALAVLLIGFGLIGVARAVGAPGLPAWAGFCVTSPR